MKPTFITAGDVRTEHNADGTPKCHYVHRKEGQPICVHKLINEYFSEGNRIYIDKYGHPWVRK